MSAPGDPAAPSPRRTTLERAALRSGDRWVESTQEQLASEGRAVQGGWPGTMSEARGLAADFSATLPRPLTFEESAWVAKAIYARAKHVWLARREPTDDQSSEGDA